MLPKSRAHTVRRIELKRQSARRLRLNATDAERKLWYCLRDKRLLGLRFRRQQPIGPYVADFYCSAAKLIIELDGSQHGNTRAQYDLNRTRWLEARGYKVLRFWNTDLQDSDYIVGAICHTIEELQNSPVNDPSPKFTHSRS
jgi:very-short-patch-repair endonuclease